MCDMREKPDVLVNLKTNEAIVNPYKGELNMTSNKDWGRHYTDTGNLEPGLYRFCGTGSHFQYWDGKKYHHIGPNYGYEIYWNNVPHSCFGNMSYQQNDKHYKLIEDKPGYQIEYEYKKQNWNNAHYQPKEKEPFTFMTGNLPFFYMDGSGIINFTEDMGAPDWQGPYSCEEPKIVNLGKSGYFTEDCTFHGNETTYEDWKRKIERERGTA